MSRNPRWCTRCERSFATMADHDAHRFLDGSCVDVLATPGWFATAKHGWPIWRHRPHPRLPIGAEDDVDPTAHPPWISSGAR